MMWWIIGIIWLTALIVLWMIVRGASRSVDENTQSMLDEEQSRYIAEYFRKQDEKRNRDQQ